MTASELREQWNNNAACKADWDAILRSPAWKAVSQLIKQEEAELSTSYERLDGDPVLARKLAEWKAVQRVFRSLETASEPPVQPVVAIEEYEHIKPE